MEIGTLQPVRRTHDQAYVDENGSIRLTARQYSFCGRAVTRPARYLSGAMSGSNWLPAANLLVAFKVAL